MDKTPEERTLWYELVVRIIKWREGFSDNEVMQPCKQVTPEEWSKYVKGSLQISKSESVSKVKDRLKTCEDLIRSHQGFS